MSTASVQEAFLDLYTCTDENLLAQVRPDLPLPANYAMRIYQTSNQSALLSSVKTIYPLLRKTVGDEAFRRIIENYVYQNPLHERDLNYYGVDLPDWLEVFLTECEDLNDMLYLVDLARLESATHRAYYDGPYQEKLLVASDYNLYDFYQWLRNGAKGDFEMGEPQLISIQNSGPYLKTELMEAKRS